MKFEVLAKDAGTRGRTGRLTTPHGPVDTPCFMPVGTKAAVKTIPAPALKEMGFRMVLANAYHLRVRPGDRAIQELGGLHKFMAWDGGILTDSGGYQIFSLLKLRTITPEGVRFLSHVDGEALFFTPEEVVDIQTRLGSDLIMPLDYPVEHPAPPEKTRQALDITVDWLGRSVKRWRQTDPEKHTLFAIIQGGLSRELRKESVERSLEFDLSGVSIGGLSLGEPKPELMEIMDYTAAMLPETKPRYAMGIGTPSDIIRAVAMGVDMFDCILPTRLGRNGWAFTRNEGVLKMRNRRFAEEAGPIDPTCDCLCCRTYSRAFIRHAFNVEEILGLSMLSLHNVHYYGRLMREIRKAIGAGTLGDMVRNAD